MFIDKAIKKINPNAQFRMTEPDEDNLDTAIIDWLNGTTPISKSDIQTQVDLLKADYDAKEYQRKRKLEYPTIEALVVALYDTEDKLAIEAKRAEVKAKYPK